MFIPGPVISALTFPGVVVHELAHQLFCRLLKVPVYEVCYFRLGNPAGYVIHARPKKWIHQVLIAFGPFFLNTLLGAFLAFPSVLTAFELKGGNPLDGLLIWLGVSIAMHAIPSRGDAASMWASVRAGEAPLLAKMVVAPLAFLLVIFSVGSIFWLDAVYGVATCVALPKFLVSFLG